MAATQPLCVSSQIVEKSFLRQFNSPFETQVIHLEDHSSLQKCVIPDAGSASPPLLTDKVDFETFNDFCTPDDGSSSPLTLHDAFSTPPGLLQVPLIFSAPSFNIDMFYGLSSEDSKKLSSYSSCDWDIDYFAVDLPVSSLYFNGLYPIGPKVDCTSYVNMKYIQDPVVRKMKYVNVISMSPILVFEDTSADFPLRTKFFEVLNNGTALKVSQNGNYKDGAMFYQQHHLHTHILMTTLQAIGVKSLRYSMYGTKFQIRV